MWHFKPEIKCDMPLVITTKVKSLDKEEWEEVMDLGIDIFFDVEKFLEVEKWSLSSANLMLS